jgi:ABC-type transport system involved in multi-copper enzyme maturation permease subunit
MGIFNFPFIWHFNTYVASFLKFFLAIVIVSMMANEYSYGTLKQNLIDGMSKKEFVLSKFLTVVLFAFSSTVFVFVMSLILGYSFSSYTELEIVFSDLIYLLAYFVKLLGFFSFCLFLGILVKRSAFALGFLLIWFLVEKISYLTLKFDIFNRDPRVDQVYAFMPLESMSNLIIEPFSRLSIIKNIQSAVGEKGIKDYDVHFASILIVLLWTAIFIFLSYKIIKKRDL